MLTTNGQLRFVRQLTQDAHTYHVRLYDNDFTPTLATILGDLVEASFNGYAAQVIDVGDWAAPVDVFGNAVAAGPELKWTSSEGVAVATIFGYWIQDHDNELCIVRRFALPQSVGPGEAIHLTISLGLNG